MDILVDLTVDNSVPVNEQETEGNPNENKVDAEILFQKIDEFKANLNQKEEIDENKELSRQDLITEEEFNNTLEILQPDNICMDNVEWNSLTAEQQALLFREANTVSLRLTPSCVKATKRGREKERDDYLQQVLRELEGGNDLSKPTTPIKLLKPKGMFSLDSPLEILPHQEKVTRTELTIDGNTDVRLENRPSQLKLQKNDRLKPSNHNRTKSQPINYKGTSPQPTLRRTVSNSKNAETQARIRTTATPVSGKKRLSVGSDTPKTQASPRTKSSPKPSNLRARRILVPSSPQTVSSSTLATPVMRKSLIPASPGARSSSTLASPIVRKSLAPASLGARSNSKPATVKTGKVMTQSPSIKLTVTPATPTTRRSLASHRRASTGQKSPLTSVSKTANSSNFKPNVFEAAHEESTSKSKVPVQKLSLLKPIALQRKEILMNTNKLSMKGKGTAGPMKSSGPMKALSSHEVQVTPAAPKIVIEPPNDMPVYNPTPTKLEKKVQRKRIDLSQDGNTGSNETSSKIPSTPTRTKLDTSTVLVDIQGINESPSIFKPRKPGVQNTPIGKENKISPWSPIRRQKPISAEDEAIACTKRLVRE